MHHAIGAIDPMGVEVPRNLAPSFIDRRLLRCQKNVPFESIQLSRHWASRPYPRYFGICKYIFANISLNARHEGNWRVRRVEAGDPCEKWVSKEHLHRYNAPKFSEIAFINTCGIVQNLFVDQELLSRSYRIHKVQQFHYTFLWKALLESALSTAHLIKFKPSVHWPAPFVVVVLFI